MANAAEIRMIMIQVTQLQDAIWREVSDHAKGT
jgi:hypothetical protein